jgi:hypothetical protein
MTEGCPLLPKADDVGREEVLFVVATVVRLPTELSARLVRNVSRGRGLGAVSYARNATSFMSENLSFVAAAAALGGGMSGGLSVRYTCEVIYEDNRRYGANTE